jgi:Uma2 family endonuclease
MSPEDVFCHGVLKSEIARVLAQQVKQDELGLLLIDATRVSSPEANLSCEPDIVFISHEAIDAGRAILVPKAGGQPGRYVEIEGPADLIVEIVSDTSVNKDTRRLPAAYFQAGVREFWLADARGQQPVLTIHSPGANGFEPVARDGDGFQLSTVLGRHFRLDAARDRRGNWAFDLRERA